MHNAPPLVHNASPLFVLGSFVVACSAKVARLPQPGESLRADALTIEAGGKGLNLALGARRLGAKVSGLLAIGNDHFTQFAESALVRAGLPLAMLRYKEGTTGSGIGLTDATGETCLAVYPGANLLLTSEDVRAAGADVRSASLVLAQFEISDDPILAAFTLARAHNVRTLLNPSPFRPIVPDILKQTSIVVMNTVEALQLAGTLRSSPVSHSEENIYASLCWVAAALLDQGVETVVITRGAQGSLAFSLNMSVIHQPAYPVHAIDTLGAGDAFAAALAVSLIEGCSLPDSLKHAAACGAITVQSLGVFEALPTRTALEAFLAAAL
jgi:ribokinase